MLTSLLGQVLSARLERRFEQLAGKLGIAFCMVHSDGSQRRFGDGPEQFRIVLCTARAQHALARFDALSIADAYMDGELTIEGDLFAAMRYQEYLGDQHPLIRLASRLEPVLVGRERVNPRWIQLHYDSWNAQLLATDADYHTYTPGHYHSDSDSLDTGAERKLSDAFQFLRLKPGDRLLDVGCGWGGMLRYAARRGVHVTGITLSHHQKQFCEELCRSEGLDARVLYQDFFTYQPAERYDAISLMGVMEDLSDYRRVLRRLTAWTRPGGRVYFDFAAERERFGTHAFVTTYIWPGTFRMVFMPEFVEAVRESPFELQEVLNDRRNYHLWMHKVSERWMEQRDAVIRDHGERVYRMFLLLWVAIAMIMDRPSHSATAYRVVLELPEDSDQRFWTRPAVRIADAVRGTAAAARGGVLHVLSSLGRAGDR
ncbi:MAG TPA: class I SAM-dependent methyltransferase [Kofleriaceae bacterium]|nr:class I SAM-dependent methyltransferase [Kofleriaceae bacterium]